MPYWIKRTISGSIICLFCGSLVTQVGGLWFCADVHCVKHADIPVEAQQEFAGWISPEPAIGTASLASGSIYSFGTIAKGGDG